MGLAALRVVPLKMLPLRQQERAAAGARLRRGDDAGAAERWPCRISRPSCASVPEVTDFVSYVGLSSPIDFNGLVRHYYLRQMPHQAEMRVNLVGKKHREAQSHAHRAAAARPPDRSRRAAQGPAQDRRAAAGPAGARLARGRGLRPARSLLRRPDRRRRHGGRPARATSRGSSRWTTRSRRRPRSWSSSPTRRRRR